MFPYKRVLLIFICLAIVLLPSVAFASNYKDGKAQIEFTAPDGWTETELSKEREIIKVKYLQDPDSVYTESIMFGYTDFYSAMPETDRVTYSRAELDNSLFSVSDIAYMYGVDENDVRSVTYNNVEYYEYKLYQTEAYGATWDFCTVQLVRFYNGYIYTFSYCYWPGYNDNYADFEDTVRSVKYLANVSPSAAPAAAKAKTAASAPTHASGSYTASSPKTYELNLSGLILSLIVTVAVYSLPVIIYRYGIRKRPVDRKKAKVVTIVYGVVAFIGMSILLYSMGYGPAGYAIVFWSYVNYRMLTNGAASMPKQELNSIKNMSGAENRYDSNDTQQPQTENINRETPISWPYSAGAYDGFDTAKQPENESVEQQVDSDITVISNELERLSGLHERGILTDEEFYYAKKRLLGKL